MSNDAFPKYDPNEKTSFKWGLNDAVVGSNVGSVASNPAAQAAEGLTTCMWSFPMNPGTYTVTGLDFVLVLGALAHCDGVWVNHYTTVSGVTIGAGDSILVESVKVSSADIAASGVQSITGLNVPFVVSSGVDHWVGFSIHKTGTVGATGMGIKRSSVALTGLFHMWSLKTDISPPANLGVRTTQTYMVMANMTFEANQGEHISLAATNAGAAGVTKMVPQYTSPATTSHNYINILGGHVTAANGALRIISQSLLSDDSHLEDLANLLTIDYTGAPDIRSFDACAVPVNNTLDASQVEADYVDSITIRDNTAMTSSFDRDRDSDETNPGHAQGGASDKDTATSCQSAKKDGLRTSAWGTYFSLLGDFITVVGTTATADLALTGSVTSGHLGIKIGSRPVVMFGDSINAGLNSTIFGNIAPKFTFPRTTIIAYRSGSMLTSATAGSYSAGYLRYKGTVGVQDLCHLRGCVFVIGPYGINDLYDATAGLDQGADADEHYQYKRLLAGCVQRVSGMLEDISSSNGVSDNHVVLVGIHPPLPTYVDPPSVLQAKFCSSYNSALRELAGRYECVFVDPMMVLNSSDIGADGLHPTASGSAKLATAIVRAYESGQSTQYNGSGSGNNMIDGDNIMIGDNMIKRTII